MKRYITHIFLLALLALGAAGCNKEGDIQLGTRVTITGFNTTGEGLIISIDTTQYPHQYQYQKYRPYWELNKPGEILVFNYAYTWSNSISPVLTIKGNESGKVYLEQPLERGKLIHNFGFTWVDGKNTYAPPAPSPETNKIGFYLENYDQPVDIYLHGKWYNEATMQMEEEKKLLVQNVKPHNWVYVDYMPEGKFTRKNGELNFLVMNAGTEEPAMEMWGNGSSTWKDVYGFPLNPETDKGGVLSFLIFINSWGQGQREIIETK